MLQWLNSLTTLTVSVYLCTDIHNVVLNSIVEASVACSMHGEGTGKAWLHCIGCDYNAGIATQCTGRLEEDHMLRYTHVSVRISGSALALERQASNSSLNLIHLPCFRAVSLSPHLHLRAVHHTVDYGVKCLARQGVQASQKGACHSTSI